MTTIKNIGEVVALVAEASTANEPSELLDGKSGDTAFPYAKFKALATVGEVDPLTKMALTGWPDGNAAWLKDDATIRLVYQSESYATNSNETYGWLMESGVKFTGSHIHYIDYDRAKFASFLDNEAAASTMFKASGHLFDRVYNVFGKEVTKKTTDKLDLAGKWGNQTNPDGTIVEFLPAKQLTQGDFFFHSFCGAWYEPANKYGAGIGFKDDIWLMGEEWNIGDSMFADPDGAGPLKGFNVANDTMGLASMVVDIKNEVAYTAPALGQHGYEKLMPMNSGHKDYVVIVASGYNHDINPAPLKVYVGRKGLDAAGNQINFDNPSLNERDRFLGANGLLYGQLYGMAANAATYAQLGITNVNADDKMLDAYLKNAAAPDDFSVRFYATDYRWNGFDTPEAVKDTEVFRWAQDGDSVGGVTEANKQPAGYTFFNSDTKVEHPGADPDGSKFRFIQNHTATGAILGVEFTSMVADLTRDLDGNKLPDYLSADFTRILPAVNGSLTLDVGGKGVGHFDAKGNPNGATAEKHIEGNTNKAVSPDGLLWVKSSDADVLIIDEDSGNDYGERKFALVLNEDTLAIEPDRTGYFLAQAGGNKNPRALAGVSTYGGTFETKSGSEFSGSWNVTALVATKADGSFYTQEELEGNGVQIVEQSRPLSEHVFIGAVQHGGESGGALKATKADYGGQLFMFSIDLPGIEPAPVVGTSGADSLLMPDAGKDLTLIGNTIFTGAGDDEVDVALSDGFENKVFTGSGADTIFAGSRDVITGGSGADQIWATAGNGNRLSGNGGDDDFVIGTMGNRALGGEGNDKFTILDGAGTNYLNGGAGSDQFWLISAPGDKPAAKQYVMDFKAGEDLVGLRGVAFANLSFTQVGTDTLLKVAGVDVGHFTNLSASSLNSQANFAGLAV
jgi:Ca2+-binding RTX toxin-like protein